MAKGSSVIAASTLSGEVAGEHRRSVVLWVKEAERHEAFLDRAVVKGHRHGLVAAGSLKLRAA